jgi:hypothetical protein
MTIELIPIVLAVLVGLMGCALLFDAWTPDDTVVKAERRRAPRIERSRRGEALVGLGVLCMAAAFAGRDTWSYSVIAAIAGMLLLILGGWANRAFLGEAIVHRGSVRRRPKPDTPT